jgi:hypothetical protein
MRLAGALLCPHSILIGQLLPESAGMRIDVEAGTVLW